MEYGEIVKIEQQKKCAEKFPCRNQMTDLPVAQSVINNNRLKLWNFESFMENGHFSVSHLFWDF